LGGNVKGFGEIVGKKAKNFELPDNTGGMVKLSEELKKGALLLAFYPGDFTPAILPLCVPSNSAITATI